MDHPYHSSRQATVVSAETIPPRLRQRPTRVPPDFVAFGRGPGASPEVYIRRQVLVDVATHAQAALPNESIGLLYGRVWQDTAGTWVVLSHFVAPEEEGASLTPGHCTITPDGSAALQQRADRIYLAEEYTGSWAHSHVYEEPSFSAPDFAHQAKKSLEAVGLLAYRRADHLSWGFTVYLGPQAIELRSDVPTDALPAALPVCKEGTLAVSPANASRGAAPPRPAPEEKRNGTSSAPCVTTDRRGEVTTDHPTAIPDQAAPAVPRNPLALPRRARVFLPAPPKALVVSIIALGFLTLVLYASLFFSRAIVVAGTITVVALLALAIGGRLVLLAAAHYRAVLTSLDRLQRRQTSLEMRLATVENREIGV